MHVVIVGGGVIGLATGWRCAQRGLAVTVVDPAPGSQASRVAAGLLPPSGDMLLGQPELAALVLRSRQLYPSFAAELEDAGGVRIGFRQNGILDVAFDAEAALALDRLARMADSFGIAYSTVDEASCRSLEPRLADGVHSGMLSPADGSIDPRRLTAGLVAAIERAGGAVLRQRVARVLLEGMQPAVRLEDGTVVRGDRLVLAAGPWTHQLPGLPPGLVPTVTPYKGHVVRLRSDEPVVSHTVRAWWQNRSVYLAPRLTGELAVGATYEDVGYDDVVRSAGVAELLDRAHRVLPCSAELAFVEAGAGLRPGSPDDLPVLGATALPEVLLATGHYRVGIQLTPVTAEVMAEAVATGELPEIARPFSPARFAAATV